MWRIIATLCLTAVAEFTPEQLDKMSSSIQTTADQLQDKVVSLSKEINPLTLKVSTAPSQMLGKSDEEKAEMIKDLKATMTKICGMVDSLRKVQAEVQKDSADAKDTVAKIQAQATDMAGDLEKLKDGPTMQHYLSKFQKAIGTLDSAATSAATCTMAAACEP
jgi:DNA anti-recombination protein RmuC